VKLTARASARLVAVALVALGVASCSAADALVTGAAGPARGAALAKSPTLLVATTRKPAGDPGRKPWFGAERGRGLAFAEARLSAPDRSLTGRVASIVAGEWGIASVGPARQTGAAQAFAEAALGRDVLLYVHGYRESFETAALSAAQLSDGIGFRGATGLFAWPSGGGTFDYVHDRESAMWSRDGLEELLLALAQSPSGGRIHVMAHSMGTLLALETLRMLRASGGEAAMAKIGAVVLASPDIDIDLFTRGIERLGPDAKKITVISSTNDRALDLSRRIAGGVVRAGAADREKLAKLEALGVRIADASDYGGGIINHDLFLSNAEVREVVKRAVERAG
jgi:esterase/lipase superfamily enzyme